MSTDIHEALERLKTIAAVCCGSVAGFTIETIDDMIEDAPVVFHEERANIEVPADMYPSCMVMLGQAGFVVAGTGGQELRRVQKRVTNMAGDVVLCDEKTTMAFYTITVRLAKRRVAEQVTHGLRAAAMHAACGGL